jgi:AhpD family alkylhydroperoxidase
MQARLNPHTVAPEPYRRQAAMEKYLADCGLEDTIKHLVKIRASQINGCAYCIDIHTKDARAEGETEQRIYAVSAWRETPFFTDKERAALAWTETVTLVSQGGVSEEVYDQIREHFDEKELVDLTWAIASINSWNRIAISFRSVPGDYQPLSTKKMLASMN